MPDTHMYHWFVSEVRHGEAAGGAFSLTWWLEDVERWDLLRFEADHDEAGLPLDRWWQDRRDVLYTLIRTLGPADPSTPSPPRTPSPTRVRRPPWLSTRWRCSTTGWATIRRRRTLRQAIAQLKHSRMGGYLARTHLVDGEWLRREGRRQDAREQLRTAHQLLPDKGAEAFADRAAGELRATGEHPRKRTAKPIDSLTAHELHIARLVATGATSGRSLRNCSSSTHG